MPCATPESKAQWPENLSIACPAKRIRAVTAIPHASTRAAPRNPPGLLITPERIRMSIAAAATTEMSVFVRMASLLCAGSELVASFYPALLPISD